MNNGYDPLELLTVRDVAKLLHRQERTVRDYIKRYKIPVVKHRIGYRGSKLLYITRGDLSKFIFGAFDNA